MVACRPHQLAAAANRYGSTAGDFVSVDEQVFWQGDDTTLSDHAIVVKTTLQNGIAIVESASDRSPSTDAPRRWSTNILGGIDAW